jgi:glycosyltransferase involved in cell wall biosynthesis
MNILLIHQYFLTPNGSGGSRFNEMTRIWSENGHDITVLSGMIYHNSGKKYPQFHGKKFAEEIHSDSVRVIRCHDSAGGQDNFISRLKVYFVFVITAIWAGLFKTQRKYDIIVVTSPPLFVGLIAYVISRIKRVPFIFEIRDLWPESAIDTGVIKSKILIKLALLFERFIYKNALAINVLTPAFRETLIRMKHVPENKIFYVSNAADFSISENLVNSFNYKNFRSELGISDETLVIIYVGAHGVANGLDQILDAAKILKNDKVLFLLLGDGMLKRSLVQRSVAEEINNVRFIDPVSKLDVFKYILSSDIGTSVLIKNDTFKTVFSNKTFDYMSCKKPILMAIDGISRDLIEDSKSGIFVEPENPYDFANKVHYYINNPQFLLEHGLNGYNYAKVNFDRDYLANSYITNIQNYLKIYSK